MNLPLALDPIKPAVLDFILQAERLYARLIATQAADFAASAEPCLGGKLLYIGELDAAGRALLVAGNIAGAASLAATARHAAQKQAIREGVTDFLVTSLSEALRILKNQVRKRETVAVCVAAGPEAVEREMLERGVLPDLLASGLPAALAESQALLTWQVAAAPAIWMPALDAIALDCLGRDPSPGASVARRWLRLAPRYLGRLAHGVRVLHCDPEIAKEFIARAQHAVNQGEIGVQVRFSFCRNGENIVAHS